MKYMPYLGLCCMLYDNNIKFKTYTWKTISTLLANNKIKEAEHKIISVWLHNIDTTQKCIDFCIKNEITDYRISSDLFPHFHKAKEIIGSLEPFIKKMSEINKHSLYLSSHPGQFVNLGSNSENVILSSFKELEYHFFLAEHIGLNEINIHLGGIYGNKENAIKTFSENVLSFLSYSQIQKLTLENDEINYNVIDTFTVCEKLELRFTIDLHHHRCFQLKEYTVSDEEAFKLARSTWKEYQRIHLSSPQKEYISPMIARPHSLFIDYKDFPEWIINYQNIHIDIEAKAKENAIFQIREYIQKLINK